MMWTALICGSVMGYAAARSWIHAREAKRYAKIALDVSDDIIKTLRASQAWMEQMKTPPPDKAPRSERDFYG